jgi:hypothetical protein
LNYSDILLILIALVFIDEVVVPVHERCLVFKTLAETRESLGGDDNGSKLFELEVALH